MQPKKLPYQCLARYQRCLNGNLIKKQWSDEDDAKLKGAVSTYGEGNWSLISTQVQGFTPQQCVYRWSKHLKTGITKGRWKPEEDKQLIISVAFNGQNWSRVAETVPTKTDVQCRERWANVLTPDVKSGPWSPEEDAALLESVDKFGIGKWSRVSKELPGRTDNACWRRWKEINRHKSTVIEDYKKSVYVMKTLLPSNHAGHKDKSELTVEDMDTVTVEKVVAQKRKEEEKASEPQCPPKKRGRKPKNANVSTASTLVFVPYTSNTTTTDNR